MNHPSHDSFSEDCRKHAAAAGLARRLQSGVVAVLIGVLAAACATVEDEVAAPPPAGDIGSTSAGLVAHKNPGALWYRMEVPYTIDSSLDESEVKAGMALWTTAGFKFVPYDSSKHFEWVAFVPGTKSYSSYTWPIGRSGQAGVPTKVYLSSSAEAGNIAHEIGHALGLAHEFQRNSPDRDSYVDVYWDDIQDGEQGNFTKLGTSWTDGCTGSAATCITGTATAGYEYGSFDYGSIMNYGSYDFGKVSAGKVAGNGALCLTLASLGIILPSCFDKSTWTSMTISKKDGSVIVANRSGLTADDKANVKKLYQTYAYGCGTFTTTSTTLTSASGSSSRQTSGCGEVELARNETDYANLQVTVQGIVPSSLASGDFGLALRTPDPRGGEQTLTGAFPSGSTSSLVLANSTPLLPGKHSIVYSNESTNIASYQLSYAFTAASVPQDSYDAQGLGNSIGTAIDLGLLSDNPWTGGKSVSGTTLHTKDDVDTFIAWLPAPGALESDCGVSGKTGPNGRPLVAGKVAIRATRKDDGRTLRTVLYRYDASGNLSLDPLKAVRPWGWDKLGTSVSCPHKEFGQKPIVFRFEDCSAGVDSTGACKKSKRHYYDFTVSYQETYEWFDSEAAARTLWTLEHEMEVMPAPTPIPPELRTAHMVDRYLNQGTVMLPLVAEHLARAPELLEGIVRAGAFFREGALDEALEILDGYDGSGGPMTEPEQMLFYVARMAEERRMATEQHIARLASPEGALDEAARLPAPEPWTRAVSPVSIRERRAPAHLGHTVTTEQAFPQGAGELRTGYFASVDGDVALVRYRLVDGIAFSGPDTALDLAREIPEREALAIIAAQQAALR